MKICIEGPSAVGKTTLCTRLQHEYDAFIIQETIVKPIQGYSPREQAIYYLNRELARYKLSEEVNESHSLVVYDTDPFKSLWFNWAFSYIDCLSLEELDDYYRKKMINKELSFLDLYIILKADDVELTQRRDNDLTRDRSEYEWVKQANEYRTYYYKYIESISPGSVVFIEAQNPLYTFTEVINSINTRKTALCLNEDDQIINWLRTSTSTRM
ncbi:hypothetical protein [Paenibacillus sp. KN14-4R]|uniref:hypothetical protein n=1 Tax=Paenibacillus sp. KN14-4R TaxID=3445773 RepID=UPI003FA12D57